MTSTKLRCGVIGAGRMGLRHIEAAQRIGMAVCAVADHSEAAAKKACETYGLDPSAAFNDADRMLRTAAPEAVVVATTAPSHCEYVLAAAHSGARYLLCEKPMASSLDEADRMIAACRERGITLAVNHQMRFMQQYTYVKSLIGSEAYGPLVSVLVAGSNFGLAMNASHYFEMFRYLTDAPVEQVAGWFEPAELANPRGAEFTDRSGRVLAKGAAGHSLYIDFSADAGHGLQVVYICRLGQIVVDELAGDMRTTARQAEFRDQPTTRYGMAADIGRQAIEPADTVAPTMAVWQALLSGASHPDGADGLHALACLAAAHESHRRGGTPVRITDPTLSRSRYFHWA